MEEKYWYIMRASAEDSFYLPMQFTEAEAEFLDKTLNEFNDVNDVFYTGCTYLLDGKYRTKECCESVIAGMQGI